MTKTIVQLLATASLCLAATGQACMAQELGAGFHPNQNFQMVESSLASAGISFRLDIHWSAIEAQQGVLAVPSDYLKFDGLAQAAAQRGTPALLVLDYGNQFYGGGPNGGELPKSSAAIQGFAKYAAFMVNHYKGSVTQFEVYNEWNSNIASTAQPHVMGDAVSYVNLLRVAYPAIKAANPKAIVIGGVVGGTDTSWINQFIAAGGLAFLDAFSVHPYVYKDAVVRPSVPYGLKLSWIPAAGAATTTPIGGTPEEAMAWLDQIKATIDAAVPGRNIPMYVTEIGWPTCTVTFCVPESTGAAYTQRFMVLAHARAWIRGVWWYELMDEGTDATNPEDRFGLQQLTGAAKPALTSLIQVHDFLQSSVTATQSTLANSGILVTGPTKDGTNFDAAWLPTDDFSLTIFSQEMKSLLNSGYKPQTAVPTTSAVPLLLLQ